MKQFIVQAMVALALAMSFSTSAFAYGSLACAAGSDRGACRVQWNLNGHALSTVWIQRLAPEAQAWIDISDALTQSAGTTDKPLEAGALYRVIGCKDSARSECVSTAVLWVPIWVDDSSSIPDTVTSYEGLVFRVNRKGDLVDQLIQYNVYRFTVVAQSSGDLSRLPPMTKPDPAMSTFNDTVQANIYPQYMRRRAAHAALNQPVD